MEKVLPLCGARPDHDDKRKWHTPAGVLSVTGAKFMNWNCGPGGGGAIDLVIHLNHLDFKAAVDWLAQHFPGAALRQVIAHQPSDLHCDCPRQIPASSGALKSTWFTSAPSPQLCWNRSSSRALSTPTPEPMPSSCYSERKTSPLAPNCAAPPQRPGVAWPRLSKRPGLLRHSGQRSSSSRCR